jgi:hypothetical protein
MSNGYALDINHTFSRLEDNQFGEGNTFSSRQGNALNNYDLDAEFGVSLLDVAHRLNVNATFELPFGEGRRWLAGGLGNAVAGGWTIALAGRYQTGFPLNISQSSNNSNLLGSNQRPNLVPGVDPMTTGSQEERAVSGWINSAAFSAAPGVHLRQRAPHESRLARPRAADDGPGHLEDAAHRRQEPLAPRRHPEPVRRPAVPRAGHGLRHDDVRPDHVGRRLRALTAVPGPVGLVGGRDGHDAS